MSNKKRATHLSVVKDEASVSQLTLFETTSVQRFEPAPSPSQLPMLEEDLDDMFSMVSEFRFVQALLPIEIAGTRSLEDVRDQFVDGMLLLEDYDQLLQAFRQKKLTPAQAKQLKTVAKKQGEMKLLLSETIADLEIQIQNLSRSRKRKSRKSRASTPGAYQLKITLNRSKPPIWRRVLVPGDFTLADLHIVIQAAMGWDDDHLHQFVFGTTCYGQPSDDAFNRMLDESEYTLQCLGLKEGSKFSYEYDFGDSWEHTIKVEKTTGDDIDHPRCTGGKRACPPEDCGGIHRYHWLLSVLSDPKHPEYEEVMEWMGEDFDPKNFSVDAVNAQW